MAKVKRGARSKKGVLFLKKQPMKECTVRLKRLSNGTIKRLLNSKHITQNFDVAIHRDVLRIEETTIISKNLSFDIELKVSSKGIVIVKPPQRPFLRPRAIVVKTHGCNLASKQKPDSTIAKSHPKPIQTLIDNAWLICKNEHKKKQHKVGVSDIVMAKVRGFQAWPAIVMECTGRKGIKVEFFGADDNEKFGFVSLNEITLFESSAHVVRLILQRNIQKYSKAVHEAEIICGIPSYASLCNE